jgi:hypothetical protein
MELERFDRLARDLAASMSRRGLVRDLAGAAIGGILVAAGVSETGARTKKKNRCKSPKIKCGKGKHAKCCACSQRCVNNACLPKSGMVTLVWNPWVNPTAPDDHGFCYPTIDVTGFAPGSYQGFAGNIEVTVIVGADGTGTGSNPGTIIANNGDAYVATVDCIASAPASTDCWA